MKKWKKISKKSIFERVKKKTHICYYENISFPPLRTLFPEYGLILRQKIIPDGQTDKQRNTINIYIDNNNNNNNNNKISNK